MVPTSSKLHYHYCRNGKVNNTQQNDSVNQQRVGLFAFCAFYGPKNKKKTASLKLTTVALPDWSHFGSKDRH